MVQERGTGPSCTHQVRPVVSVHHFSPCEHGQEASCDHFHVGGPGHARGHGRWAGWGAKSAVLKGSRLTTKRNKRHSSGGTESEHLGQNTSTPAPRVLVYEARTLRGRMSLPGLRQAFNGFLVLGAGPSEFKRQLLSRKRKANPAWFPRAPSNSWLENGRPRSHWPDS